MPKTLDVDFAKVAGRLPSSYPHVGIYDVRSRKAFAARNDLARKAIDMDHAELFVGGGNGGVAAKDRFVCFWFYPPNAGQGLVQGYPVDWTEANLLVRLEPRWSYPRQMLLPSHQERQIEANIEQQIGYAGHLMGLYRAGGLQVPISVHMIGPRGTDSHFYAHRWEPPY